MGHTSKSCKVKKAEQNPASISPDDLAFWQYVVPEARPSTLVSGYDQDSDSDTDDSLGDESESDSEGMDID